MFNFEQKTTTPHSNLSDDLLQLYHDFAEFNDYHSFFCDAFAGVVSDDAILATSTVFGFNRCTSLLKFRMEDFKSRVKALQDKACMTEVAQLKTV